MKPQFTFPSLVSEVSNLEIMAKILVYVVYPFDTVIHQRKQDCLAGPFQESLRVWSHGKIVTFCETLLRFPKESQIWNGLPRISMIPEKQAIAGTWWSSFVNWSMVPFMETTHFNIVGKTKKHLKRFGRNWPTRLKNEVVMPSAPCYNAYLSNFCWARLGPWLNCFLHLLPMDQFRLSLHIGHGLDFVFPRLALRFSVCHRNLSKCSSFLLARILYLSMALLSRYRCWRVRLFHGLVFRRKCSNSWFLAPVLCSLHL